MGKKTLLILSVLSGLLLSVPWTMASFSWILFFAFIPLLIVEDQITREKENFTSIILFLYALLTFLVWNVLSTWWIGYVSVSGMFIIAVLNSFLMAFVWWLMHLIHRKFSSRSACFSLIVFWLSFEFLHFNWSVEWPWLTLGNGFANAVKLIQWYEFTGVLGGSLWILLVNVLLFSIFKSFGNRAKSDRIQLFIWFLLLFVLPAGWSIFRFNSYSVNVRTTEVVVLQPNIDPFREKFSGMSIEEQTNRLISLAETIVTDSTGYVLAPETALPLLWEDEAMKQNQLLKPIVSFMNNYPGLRFVAGAMTQRKINAGSPVSFTARPMADGSFYEVYNSALMIDHSPLVQVAHKSLLVSGVEKMPFERYFSFLGKYVVNVGGVSGSIAEADEITVFEGGGGEKIGSVICFESAFGGYVGSSVTKGANLIFVITNDGWWKDSPGVDQHFSYSRLRAIETRRSVVRSANTGISGIINERGEVVKETRVNFCTAISSRVNLNNAVTFYARYGDYIGRISLLISGIIWVNLLLYLFKNRK